jgi:hypothetical protein
MDVWFHNENTYPFVPQEVLDRADSVRASLPNKYCDPKIAADLFEEVLDEFMLYDDQGLNVVAIEHHAGINSLFGANPLILGILARQTRQARILSLGTLVSLRPDPVRIAEEYATADVISRGRLEIGFVKSGGSEMASNNANPVNNVERGRRPGSPASAPTTSPMRRWSMSATRMKRASGWGASCCGSSTPA